MKLSRRQMSGIATCFIVAALAVSMRCCHQCSRVDDEKQTAISLSKDSLVCDTLAGDSKWGETSTGGKSTVVKTKKERKPRSRSFLDESIPGGN